MNHGQHSNLQSAIVGNTVDNSLQRREGRKEPFLLRVKDKIKGQKDRVGTERKYWVIWLVIGNL